MQGFLARRRRNTALPLWLRLELFQALEKIYSLLSWNQTLRKNTVFLHIGTWFGFASHGMPVKRVQHYGTKSQRQGAPALRLRIARAGSHKIFEILRSFTPFEWQKFWFRLSINSGWQKSKLLYFKLFGFIILVF